MKIEDKELRDLFKIECEEHLQNLDSGFLKLEKDPTNKMLLEEILRAAHSLKGGARMVLMEKIETIAHRFESILAAAKKGESLLTSETIDRLYESLDAMRKLVNEAVTGEPAGVLVSDVLARLQPVEAVKTETGAVTSTGEPKKTVLDQPGIILKTEEAKIQPVVKAEALSETAEQLVDEVDSMEETQPAKTTVGNSRDGEFRIETIRVATDKLDGLLPLLGELNVTKNRMAHGLETIEQIMGAWQRLYRGRSNYLAVFSEISSSLKDGSTKKLMNHHKQENQIMERLGTLLDEVRTAAYDDSSKLDVITKDLDDGVRSIRLLPFSTVFNYFPRMVRDIARSQSKEVELIVEGGETTADKRVIEEIKDPLMHMIRNAIDHGIEAPDYREKIGKPRKGSIHLTAYQTASNIFIQLSDNGRGLDLEAIKRTALKRKLCGLAELEAMSPAEVRSLIFISGFSTSDFVSDVSGRGVGLDVVRTNVERLKGFIKVDSDPNTGITTFSMQLPITMSTARVLIVEVDGRKYAIFVEYVEASHLAPRKDIFTIEGRQTIIIDGRPVSVARLSDLLELRQSVSPDSKNWFSGAKGPLTAVPCVILAIGDERLGLLVDELLDEQEIVLKPQSKLLSRVRNIAGSTILGTGEVCMLLNPHDLIKSVRRRELRSRDQTQPEEAERTKVVLMAEDSLTTRTQMKRILEGGGYEVEVAVDGLDAFNRIGSRPIDALVSDIMMPNMDGLALTKRVRGIPKYKELPIILVTSLSSEDDRKKGLDAGANAYITKPAFDQKLLLETLRRLV
jgi:two-component system chemotaxis sensor kinase CheA